MAEALKALQQSLAGRYRIQRELGRGGMATVYLAEDLKHRRLVALKVLDPEIASAIGPDRFVREIEIAARLSHPHILPLHDSGEAGGLLYYVMPYVDGESLRDRLAREKQLPLEEALRIAAEVGESLEYAHRQGVIHRDIKPENLLLSQGHALVADFGIAKALEAAGAQRLTTASATVGTPAYMSPEQWSGAQARVDGRSDVYSLACVVYEMLGGEPPFTGPSAESIVHQHLSIEPRPVTALRPTVPQAVARAINHALSKAAADRPQSAAAFVSELEKAAVAPPLMKSRWHKAAVAGGAVLLALVLVLLWWARARTPAAKTLPSIAVLPLKDLSGDAGQGYFADGMTDELITSLAKLSSLTVIASSAVLTYRNSNKPLSRIARELGVRFVLEGSVARSSERAHIATRLIEARTGRNLWAESYDRGLHDVLSLQNEVALAVAKQIQVRLTPAEHVALTTVRKVNPDAHELYLKARFSIDPGTKEGAQQSIRLLKQALEIDPDYALAYASLADAHYLLSNWFLLPAEAMPLARHYAAKALELDSTLAEGHTVLGLVTFHYDWRFDKGIEHFRKAVALNPGSALARQWHAYALNELGRFAEARAEYSRAREIDPVSNLVQWLSTWPSFYARRYDQTIGELTPIQARDPTFWPTYSLMGEAYEFLGDLPRALRTLERARDLGGTSWVIAAIGRVHAKAGRPDEARRILRDLEAARETSYVQPYALATIDAALGHSDRAFELLEESYRQRSEDMCLLKIDPRLERLHSDPRFSALLRRVGFPG